MTDPLKLLAVVCVLATACGDDDSPAMDGGIGSDGGPEMCSPRDPDTRPDPGACVPAADDYAPCEDDAWPSCVSDQGAYVRIQSSISTIARVRAFEEIAAAIFDPTRDPSPDDFLEARAAYQEEEGLDSRVVRRYDPHVTVPAGTDCTVAAVAEMFPDYCVGPITLQPIILDGLMRGAMGEAPTRVHAARVEGGLLWFLAVSVYKEALTCATQARDCDSAYAYYAGGEPARGGLGLARYVAEVSPFAHDRAWDGILAVRCWRDLDRADTATNLALRDRAAAQLDRAVVVGSAKVLASRLRAAAEAEGDVRAYHWAFAQVFSGYVAPFYEARDAANAAALEAALMGAEPPATTGALADALDATFDCP